MMRQLFRLVSILFFVSFLCCGCGAEALYYGMEAAQVASFATSGAKVIGAIDDAHKAQAEKYFADAQQQARNGQLAMAEESIKKAIDIWPDHNQYRSFAGSLYYQMAMQRGGDVGYLKKAREAFVSCLPGNEKNSKLYNAIAWNYFLVADNPEEGLKYASQAIEIDGRNPSYVGTKGCLDLQKGDLQTAISELEEAANAHRGSNPGNASINLYYLSLAYDKNGDAAKAQSAYVEAVKLQPVSYFRNKVEPQLKIVKIQQ